MIKKYTKILIEKITRKSKFDFETVEKMKFD